MNPIDKVFAFDSFHPAIPRISKLGSLVYCDHGSLLADGLYTPPFRTPFVVAREQPAAIFALFDLASSRFSIP